MRVISFNFKKGYLNILFLNTNVISSVESNNVVARYNLVSRDNNILNNIPMAWSSLKRA